MDIDFDFSSLRDDIKTYAETLSNEIKREILHSHRASSGNRNEEGCDYSGPNQDSVTAIHREIIAACDKMPKTAEECQSCPYGFYDDYEKHPDFEESPHIFDDIRRKVQALEIMYMHDRRESLPALTDYFKACTKKSFDIQSKMLEKVSEVCHSLYGALTAHVMDAKVSCMNALHLSEQQDNEEQLSLLTLIETTEEYVEDRMKYDLMERWRITSSTLGDLLDAVLLQLHKNGLAVREASILQKEIEQSGKAPSYNEDKINLCPCLVQSRNPSIASG